MLSHMHKLVAGSILAIVAFPAFAALDAPADGFLLQLLLGGVAGVLLVLKLYWSKVLTLFGKPEEADDPLS